MKANLFRYCTEDDHAASNEKCAPQQTGDGPDAGDAAPSDANPGAEKQPAR